MNRIIVMIRLLGASQNHLLADGAKLHVEKEKDIEYLGRTNEFASLRQFTQEFKPDVVVMCGRFAGEQTPDVINKYLEEFADMKLVLMTSCFNPVRINEFLSTRLKGLVHSINSPEELITAIRDASQSRTYISKSISTLLVKPKPIALINNVFQNSSLSDREVEILQNVANGKSSKAIALQLYLATSTVEAHRKNIMSKLNLHNIADLTRYAIKEKYITV